MKKKRKIKVNVSYGLGRAYLQRRTNEESKEQKLFNFRVALLKCVYISGVASAFGLSSSEFGGYHPSKEHISKILSNENVRTKLRKCLESVDKKRLGGVYKKFFKNRLPTKNRMVDELYSKFIGSKTSLEKRTEESKNILDLKDFKEELTGFFELCEILIPNEILCLILDYLPRNYQVLIGAGSVCKTLYIRLLATWKSIKVTRTNLYQVSVMALQNATHIELNGLTKREQFYIFEHLNPKKLRSLKLDFGPKKGTEALRNIEEYHKNCESGELEKNKPCKPFPFENVTELSTNYVQERAERRNNVGDGRTNVIFPNLSKCKILETRSKGWNRKIGPFFSNMRGIVHLGVKMGHYLKESLDFVSKFPLSSIKVLEFQGVRVWGQGTSTRITNDRSFRNFVEECEKIEKLEFCLELPMVRPINSIWRTGLEMNMGTFFEFCSKKCQNLENISIIQQETERRIRINSNNKKKTGMDHLVKVKYFTNSRIKILEIRSSKTRTTKLTVVDFNLEDMLNQHFFAYNGGIKVFKGDLSLTSRSGKTRTEFGIRKVIDQVLELMKGTWMRMEKFDVKIRNGDRFFQDEQLHFRFDRRTSTTTKVTNRLRIKYVNKKFSTGLYRRLQSIFVRKYEPIEKAKKPCLFLLHLFFKKTLFSIPEDDRPDILSIEAFSYSYKIQEHYRSDYRRGMDHSVSKTVDFRLMKDLVTKYFNKEVLDRNDFAVSHGGSGENCFEIVKKCLI